MSRAANAATLSTLLLLSTLGFHHTQVAHTKLIGTLEKCIQFPKLWDSEVPTPLGRGTDLKVCIINIKDLFRSHSFAPLVCSTVEIRIRIWGEDFWSRPRLLWPGAAGVRTGCDSHQSTPTFRRSRSCPSWRMISGSHQLRFPGPKNPCGCSQYQEREIVGPVWMMRDNYEYKQRPVLKYSVSFDHVICGFYAWCLQASANVFHETGDKGSNMIKHDQTPPQSLQSRLCNNLQQHAALHNPSWWWFSHDFQYDDDDFPMIFPWLSHLQLLTSNDFHSMHCLFTSDFQRRLDMQIRAMTAAMLCHQFQSGLHQYGVYVWLSIIHGCMHI